VTLILKVVVLVGANVVTGDHFVERRQELQQIIQLLTTNPLLHFIMIQGIRMNIRVLWWVSMTRTVVAIVH